MILSKILNVIGAFLSISQVTVIKVVLLLVKLLVVQSFLSLSVLLGFVCDGSRYSEEILSCFFVQVNSSHFIL